MSVRLSGWQRHPTTKVWHFYAGGPYYSFSMCQRQTRRAWPLIAEPESLNLCDRCIQEMRKTVAQLEKRREDAVSDPESEEDLDD